MTWNQAAAVPQSMTLNQAAAAVPKMASGPTADGIGTNSSHAVKSKQKNLPLD
jgi:hypothetical protein